MNRRDFVSRVTLGAAAACTHLGTPAFAAPAPSGFKFRFIGMMAFIERKDRSFLVATPGQSHHHATHVPFLMARKSSAVARRLEMVQMPGVVPFAFDNQLGHSHPADFVFRSLQNTAIEVISGTTDRVINEASQMVHLATLAPGKRVRGNIEKWAPATIALRGGRLENSAAHPDAGKTWSFGSHRQQLTDAVNYYNLPGTATTIRLTSGTDVQNLTVEPGEAGELWMISSAVMDDRMNNPVMPLHSELLFEFLVDAKPVLGECAAATGRPDVPSTAVPFARPVSASAGIIASEAPPLTDICWPCDILLDLLGLDR
jgi:hypothetical protein